MFINRSTTASGKPAFLALAAIGFLATAPASADPDRPDSDKEESAEPQDQHSDILVIGDAIDLQGPKAVASLVNTPRSIVVLPAKVIEDSGATTLADALRTVPGITFGSGEGGNPLGDRPFIRGFDSQGSIFVDGVRDPGSQSREVFDIDQIQIVRGSDSTLGGRGSAGGSINIVSKLPVQGDFIRGAVSGGTADYKRATLDLNYRIADGVGVRLAAMWDDQGVAGRDALWQRRWGIAPSITIGMGTNTRLTASYYYLESHELPDSGIPFLYTLANAPGSGITYDPPALGTVTTIGGATGTVSRSAFYGLADRDFRNTTTNQAMLRAEHDFGAITLRNTTRFERTTQDYIWTQPDDSQGNVYGTNAANPATAGGYVWRRANTRYGFDESIVNQTDLYGDFHTGGIRHSFALGTEISWEKARRGTYVLATGSTQSPRCGTAMLNRDNCASLFDPNPYDPWVNYVSDTSTTQTPITRGGPATETRNSADTVSVYGFDSITLTPSLILNLGARYDRFQSTLIPPILAAAPVQFSRTDNLFNWQAGLTYKPTANTSLYASYATAATPPNALLGEGAETNALPTTNTAANLALLDSLKVQQTKSYEVGAKASLFHNRLQLGLAGFDTEIDNARVTGDDGTVQFLGKTRIRGVELTFNGQIVKGWTVFGGYTHLDPKVIDGGYVLLGGVAYPAVSTGKQVPNTAKDSFTLWTEVEPIKGLQLGGGAYYSSRIYGGYQDNRSATLTTATEILYRYVPAYWRFDARIGYHVNPHWQISVNVQNLTDETYYSQIYATHYATVAPGRSAFATLSFNY